MTPPFLLWSFWLSFPKGICVPLGPALKRWLRFNLVGVLGIGVQLFCLALLSRLFPHHPLCATAIAIELTLLHNFTWHMHYTWRDRRDSNSRLRQAMRFHLSNGLVSFAGNFAFMGFLMRSTHLPLLVANLIAILCCSVANFFIGDRWAFAAVRHSTHPRFTNS